MSDADNSGGGSGASSSEDGVLAKLPPTRPQRTSRRRAEARKAGSPAKTGAPGRPGVRAGARAPQDSSAQERARQKDTRERRVGPRIERAATGRSRESGERPDAVPKQGFESEGDSASGPVQPPGGMELVASGAEIIVELARAGLSAGEQLLGDLVRRLPRP
jgi:hypothetical protein